MIDKAKLIDFTERVGATFVMTFMSLATVTTLSNLTELKAAGIAAGLSAGKYAAVQAQAYLNSPAPTD